MPTSEETTHIGEGVYIVCRVTEIYEDMSRLISINQLANSENSDITQKRKEYALLHLWMLKYSLTDNTFTIQFERCIII